MTLEIYNNIDISKKLYKYIKLADIHVFIKIVNEIVAYNSI